MRNPSIQVMGFFNQTHLTQSISETRGTAAFCRGCAAPPSMYDAADATFSIICFGPTSQQTKQRRGEKIIIISEKTNIKSAGFGGNGLQDTHISHTSPSWTTPVLGQTINDDNRIVIHIFNIFCWRHSLALYRFVLGINVMRIELIHQKETILVTRNFNPSLQFFTYTSYYMRYRKHECETLINFCYSLDVSHSLSICRLIYFCYSLECVSHSLGICRSNDICKVHLLKNQNILYDYFTFDKISSRVARVWY